MCALHCLAACRKPHHKHLFPIPGYVCPYDVLSGSKAVSSVSYTQVGTASDLECQTRCDELGIGCWAAAWEQAPAGLCRLYRDTSPFFFDDAAKIDSDPGFTLLIKRCYESEYSRTGCTWKQPHLPPTPPPPHTHTNSHLLFPPEYDNCRKQRNHKTHFNKRPARFNNSSRFHVLQGPFHHSWTCSARTERTPLLTLLCILSF